MYRLIRKRPRRPNWLLTLGAAADLHPLPLGEAGDLALVGASPAMLR
jgi:hypothetical protein